MALSARKKMWVLQINQKAGAHKALIVQMGPVYDVVATFCHEDWLVFSRASSFLWQSGPIVRAPSIPTPWSSTANFNLFCSLFAGKTPIVGRISTFDRWGPWKEEEPRSFDYDSSVVGRHIHPDRLRCIGFASRQGVDRLKIGSSVGLDHWHQETGVAQHRPSRFLAWGCRLRWPWQFRMGPWLRFSLQCTHTKGHNLSPIEHTLERRLLQ